MLDSLVLVSLEINVVRIGHWHMLLLLVVVLLLLVILLLIVLLILVTNVIC